MIKHKINTKMKLVIIILGILFIVFFLIQIFALINQKNIETYHYTVIKKYDLIEIRNYEEALFTSTKLPGKSYKNSSSEGFSILAGYIFGDNETNEKISMTSPVSISLEDSMTVRFLVPKKYTIEALPLPNHPKIEFIKEPSKTVAAICFGGWTNDKKIHQYRQLLINALNHEGIDYFGRFSLLGYNPPYEIFNRRNEIIVEIESNHE